MLVLCPELKLIKENGKIGNATRFPSIIMLVNSHCTCCHCPRNNTSSFWYSEAGSPYRKQADKVFIKSNLETADGNKVHTGNLCKLVPTFFFGVPFGRTRFTNSNLLLSSLFFFFTSLLSEDLAPAIWQHLSVHRVGVD